MKRFWVTVLAVACIFAAGSAFAETPRVVALVTENTQLRASAAIGGAVVAELVAGAPLRVVTKGTTLATVGSKKAPWHKVATAGGKEGFVFGGSVKLVETPMTYDDFGDDTLWLDYMSVALRPGERVVAVEGFELVEVGAGGYWYPSPVDYEDELALLVIWDDYLDAIPSPDYLPEGFPSKLMARTYWVSGKTIELAGEKAQADFPKLEAEYVKIEDPARLIPPGSRVVLGEHTKVDPKDPESTFWADAMDEYVGQETVLVDHQGKDSWNQAIAHVEADDSSFYWRLSDMYLVERVSESNGYAAEDGDMAGDYAAEYAEENPGMIKIGSTVVLGRHDDLAGSANWSKEMEPFVGKRAKVTELAGADTDGFLGVRVEGNTYFWRIRNLTLFGRGKAGSYGYKVGDHVILGRHRPIGPDGAEFWADEMGEYLGMEAIITELVGSDVDDTGCFVVHVDVDAEDDGGWFWRVETLSPAP